MPTATDEKIVRTMTGRGIGFVTSVPCKQLAGVIARVDETDALRHVPATREDEGMGLCAGAFMGGLRPMILMQNTALGVTVNALATLVQFYQFPLPMLISYRGEVGEKVACQVEMATHSKALLAQLGIPTYHFHTAAQVAELGGIIEHSFMASKPVAILADAAFWAGAAP
ncbi:MAG: sulfopyruvate decarboxylase subunit alpha [Paracoccaceae bacterium]